MTLRTVSSSTRPALAGALSSEALKLWTLRSQRALAAGALLLIISTGILLMISTRSRLTDPRFAGQPVTPEPPQLVDSVLWAQIVIAVLAVLGVTSEYTSGQARLSLLAVPSRATWLAAKAAVSATLGFLVGVVGTGLLLGVAALLLPGSEVGYAPELAESVGLALGSGAYLAAIAALATGVAAALRHVVAALTAVLGLLVVVPALLASIPGIRAAADYTPTHAGRRLISDFPTTAELDPSVGFGVLALWTVLALLVAGVLLQARDA